MSGLMSRRAHLFVACISVTEARLLSGKKARQEWSPGWGPELPVWMQLRDDAHRANPMAGG
uniref:Uncharacterized protein n=1 Tax=Anguilla anguilla TaxID=7936 RepID=A0A0E9ULN5_ANGAN